MMKKQKDCMPVRYCFIPVIEFQSVEDKFFHDCACLFSKRNTDITSNIAKYSIEFHFLQGRKGQQSIAVKSFYDNYCSYCTMQN